MNIVFRVDSSLQIGTGHVMRCLALAEQLKKQNANIAFLCRDFTGNIIPIIRDKGFKVLELSSNNSKFKNCSFEWFDKNWQEDALATLHLIKAYFNHIDLMIIDHYGIDINWESHLRSHVKKMMVIDDLANREHICDILLDQNFYLNYKTRYTGLVPENCILLLGPNYVLLREEFINMANSIRKRDGQIKRVLVFFGGTDPTDETTKTLKALSYFGHLFKVDVIVGATNPKLNIIEAICNEQKNYHFYSQVNNISEFMNKADLAIGAGGSTTWERCFFGLPSITVIVADNQKEATESVCAVGATINLGESAFVTKDKIICAVNNLMHNSDTIINLSLKSKELVDAQFAKTYPLIDVILKR